jgi:type IV pilus assembly protein PilB
MGIEPFLVVASLNTVIAQRLVRRICDSCKKPDTVAASELLKYGVSPEEVEGKTLYRGQGCQTCNKSGYKSRLAIYEVLEFSPTLKEMVLKGSTATELKRQAIREGLKTLRSSGLTKALEGKTTLEEALSATVED